MTFCTIIEDKFDVKFFSSPEVAVKQRIKDAETRCKQDKNKTGTKCYLISDDVPALIKRLFDQNWKCPLTGFDMTLQRNHRHVISLDRIDSSGDYTLHNVQWVCWGANNKKGKY